MEGNNEVDKEAKAFCPNKEKKEKRRPPSDIIGLEYPDAVKQAEQIKNYWHKRGATQVAAWAVEEKVQFKSGSRTIWIVQTNLQGGLPPKGARNV
jgi:hypothetical protein